MKKEHITLHDLAPSKIGQYDVEENPVDKDYTKYKARHIRGSTVRLVKESKDEWVTIKKEEWIENIVTIERNTYETKEEAIEYIKQLP